MLEILYDGSFLASVPRFVTPILLAALGGALCDRAGVFNIGLEGMMLVGAFAAVCGSFLFGSAPAGALVAVIAGVSVGLIFAEFSVRRSGDPIVVSIAINLLGAGITTYLLRAIFHVSGALSDPRIVGFSPVRLPLVADVPVLGPLLGVQFPLFYLALVCVPLMSWFLARHRSGLHIRAAGENPGALSAVGGSPRRARLLALILCGAFCGLAGAQLAIANVTLYVENMTAGRGWIAVVAVLLARGRPVPILLVASLFGFVDSYSFRLQGFGFAEQLAEVLPYLASLLALVIASAWRRREVHAAA